MLPCLSETVGIVRTTLSCLLKRSKSPLIKKKARSRCIGPPRDPPKLFHTSAGGLFGSPLSSSPRLINQSLALVAEFRLYSYRLPCHWFVPPLVAMAICAPEERPSSAL